MNREEMTLLGFEIVAYAGDARSKLLEALKAAENGDFAKADSLVVEAGSCIAEAHNSQTAMLAVIIVTVWKSLGYAMIFYLSALEKVPKELYEASGLDGAKGWQRFRDVTIPCISPTTFFLVIITMVTSLQAYDQIQILTQGGPSGSTRTLLYMYYQLGFQEFNMGQATAVAVIMVIITVLLSAVQFTASKKWLHY